MMANDRELTELQQQYIEHAEEAQSKGVPLAQHYRSLGLDVKRLYGAKQQLRRKGLLSASPRAAERSERPNFVAVQVTPPSATAVICRLRHPSGWAVECADWPPVAWVSAFVNGGADATA